MDRRSTPVNASVDDAWRGFNAPLWIVFGVFALTSISYWPTVVEIVSRWNEYYQYTHGWLLLGASGWLIWSGRDQLRSTPLKPARGGWVVAALASLTWFVAFSAGLLAGTMVVLPIVALAAIWAIGGRHLVLRAATPVLLLYFAIPGWEALNPILQWLTSFVVTGLASALGIPVVLDRYLIHIPEGSFIVEDACSGLRFLVVALIVAVVQGELERCHLRSRLGLLCLAVVAALIANWARVLIVIVAGHTTNMQHFLVKVDHYYFGWGLFAAALVIYFRLARHVTQRGQAERSVTQAGIQTNSDRNVAVIVLSVFSLMLGPTLLIAKSSVPTAHTRDITPPIFQNWSGPSAEPSRWQPVFVNADEEALAIYRSRTLDEVALYSASYYGQRQGKELLGISNSVLGVDYSPISVSTREVRAGQRLITVSEHLAINLSSQKLLVWSIFAVDGEPDPMGLRSQLQYGLRSVLRTPVASVIAFAALCRPNCETARASLSEFAEVALPPILQGIERSSGVGPSEVGESHR